MAPRCVASPTLLTLPPEIRYQVFHHLYSAATYLSYLIPNNEPHLRPHFRPFKPAFHLALRLTCHQLNREMSSFNLTPTYAFNISDFSCRFRKPNWRRVHRQADSLIPILSTLEKLFVRIDIDRRTLFSHPNQRGLGNVWSIRQRLHYLHEALSTAVSKRLVPNSRRHGHPLATITVEIYVDGLMSPLEEDETLQNLLWQNGLGRLMARLGSVLDPYTYRVADNWLINGQQVRDVKAYALYFERREVEDLALYRQRRGGPPPRAEQEDVLPCIKDLWLDGP